MREVRIVNQLLSRIITVCSHVKIEKNKRMNKEQNFLDAIVNYAVVIRADIETVQKVKRCIESCSDVDVVYQRYSFNKLMVEEDKDEG